MTTIDYFGIVVVRPNWLTPEQIAAATPNYVAQCPNCNHRAPSNLICPYIEAVSCGGPLHCPWCGLFEVIV